MYNWKGALDLPITFRSQKLNGEMISKGTHRILDWSCVSTISHTSPHIVRTTQQLLWVFVFHVPSDNMTSEIFSKSKLHIILFLSSSLPFTFFLAWLTTLRYESYFLNYKPKLPLVLKVT